MVWNIPNVITLLRMGLAAGYLCFALKGLWVPAFWTFLIASATDMIDGALARLLGQRTEQGAFLDPMADKLLMLLGFTTLTYTGFLPAWLTVLVIGRDLMITGGVFYLRARRIEIEYRPSRLSKATTFSQIVVVLLGLIPAAYSPGDLLKGYDRLIAGLLTLTTTVQYFWRGLKIYKGRHAPQTEASFK